MNYGDAQGMVETNEFGFLGKKVRGAMLNLFKTAVTSLVLRNFPVSKSNILHDLFFGYHLCYLVCSILCYKHLQYYYISRNRALHMGDIVGR